MGNCTRKDGVIFRWEGDEFVILIPNIHEHEDIERILGLIKDEIKLDDINKNEINVSIGTAFYPDDAATFYELLRIADKNMYKIKLK